MSIYIWKALRLNWNKFWCLMGYHSLHWDFTLYTNKAVYCCRFCSFKSLPIKYKKLR